MDFRFALSLGSMSFKFLVMALCGALASEERDFSAKSELSASPFLVEEADAGLAAAPTPSTRPISNLAIDLIATFESLELLPYDGPAGYCTIGFGHLIHKSRCDELAPYRNNQGDCSIGYRYVIHEGGCEKGSKKLFSGGISKDQAIYLLGLDSSRAGTAAQTYLPGVELTDGQYGALASFVFNLGANNFANSTLRKKINAGVHNEAPAELRKWVFARNSKTGKKERLNGLVARRNCEGVLYRDLLLSPFERVNCERAMAAAGNDSEMIDVETGQVVSD